MSLGQCREQSFSSECPVYLIDIAEVSNQRAYSDTARDSDPERIIAVIRRCSGTLPTAGSGRLPASPSAP
jgi:hypothetical protein